MILGIIILIIIISNSCNVTDDNSNDYNDVDGNDENDNDDLNCKNSCWYSCLLSVWNRFAGQLSFGDKIF